MTTNQKCWYEITRDRTQKYGEPKFRACVVFSYKFMQKFREAFLFYFRTHIDLTFRAACDLIVFQKPEKQVFS